MRTEQWSTLTEHLHGRPVRVLEIGCFEGRSTIWWMDHLLTHPNSRLVCIDPQLNGQHYSTFLNNISRHAKLPQVSFIRGLSHRILPGQPENAFDFIYIDGSHKGWDVMLDACLCFRKLKPGGIILFDDYEWTGHPHYNNRVHPSVGIDGFIAAHKPLLEIIQQGYQVAVRKITEQSADLSGRIRVSDDTDC